MAAVCHAEGKVTHTAAYRLYFNTHSNIPTKFIVSPRIYQIMMVVDGQSSKMRDQYKNSYILLTHFRFIVKVKIY